MKEILAKYIPETTVDAAFDLIKRNKVHLQIVNQRVTRHGDYRVLQNGQHKITINASGNKYRFFITLVHEMAHLEAFEVYGRRIKPHGLEWKITFQKLMLPFIHPSVFPNTLLPLVARHFRNPKASSDTDAKLALALKYYDLPNNKNYIFEIPHGAFFKMYNGKVFKRGAQKVKRFECLEVSSGRTFLFNPNAEVELLKE
ncbi:MAG: sprT domain-containing protein [Flavobacteriaceae bacterium CG_4_8_14_3_um_filter_34_10]|nr:sprT domain-containing protein [Flavobacteriia bacterium]OIP51963.1 MAG: sprT domain-containing protein [Flavobacteriaceae bacterium CG2_30_34_30]PIQ18893.1 MAG: sprT domain-containing protein [Flavobacteriaceae bacterium CG18_big_fil_WC_8_21_14_2_50_34_36]PIV51417.1 MAG: sprT domain-containing protein [Flavobacteriaceae bacterium CG02_land_8_20_14_3_00_34_13]PIX08328.1 MAG: sprT domain-containing protein [Flavobacteriaceae bacterium CG_4_8_14_3_um_filter_34_10]PIZ08427.1 MAG: sprT domain-c